MTATSHAPQVRSLYRRLLRELPARQPSLLANPSPVHQRIRSSFSNTDPAHNVVEELHQGEQIVQYLKAQRMYTTLVERYNPGMSMSEEEKLRLTARRVGMDLPTEYTGSGSGGEGKN